MPRGMNRWFFALGVFMMAGGWTAIEFVKEQTLIASLVSSTSDLPAFVWEEGSVRDFVGGRRQRFHPGRAIFVGGGLSFTFGAGLSALAAFSLLEDKRRRPRPERRDDE